jgi:hypothetical protein
MNIVVEVLDGQHMPCQPATGPECQLPPLGLLTYVRESTGAQLCAFKGSGRISGRVRSNCPPTLFHAWCSSCSVYLVPATLHSCTKVVCAAQSHSLSSELAAAAAAAARSQICRFWGPAYRLAERQISAAKAQRLIRTVHVGHMLTK